MRGKHDKRFPRIITTHKVLIPLSIFSTIIFALFFPDWIAGLLPLITATLSLTYPFIKGNPDDAFYKRACVAFCGGLSLLLIFLVVSYNLPDREKASVFTYVTSSILPILGLIIVADLVINYKGMDKGWTLRLISAAIFIVSGTVLITSEYMDRNVPVFLKYLLFSALMASGILLAIYAWMERDRSRMSWFYIYTSFFAVIALPMFMKILSEIISRPELVPFSCHASGVAERKNGILEFGSEKGIIKKRKENIEELCRKGYISPEFKQDMVQLLNDKGR